MARKTKTPPKPKTHDCPWCVERGRSNPTRLAFDGFCVHCSAEDRLEKAAAPPDDSGVSLEACRLEARDKVTWALRVWLRESRADLERHGRRSFAGQEAAKRIQAAEEELKARGLTEEEPGAEPRPAKRKPKAKTAAPEFRTCPYCVSIQRPTLGAMPVGDMACRDCYSERSCSGCGRLWPLGLDHCPDCLADGGYAARKLEPRPGCVWCVECSRAGVRMSAEPGSNLCSAHRAEFAAETQEAPPPAAAPAPDPQAELDAEDADEFDARLRALQAREREAEQAVASAKAAAKTARRLQIEAERALSLAIDLDGPRASRLARMRELFAATQATAEAFRAARRSWQLARLARLKAAEQLRSALAGWFERLPLIERMTGAEPKLKGAKANG